MSKATNKARVTIDLDDVRTHGGVAAAVAECAGDEIRVADPRAMGGQTFATSGPGPGRTTEFGPDDYARACIRGERCDSGADPSECMAIDPSDGRLATGEDSYDEDGDWDGGLEWSDDSVVRVERPSADDAVERPALVAEMARSVVDYHGPCSDRAAWRRLIEQIREAAEALEDIDADDLGD